MTRKFVKHDGGKSRLDLLPPQAIELVGKVLTHGAKKYTPGNWKLCRDPSRYVAALLRHVMRDLAGEDLDDESGLFHLAHAACCALMALEIKIDARKQKRGKRGKRGKPCR